MELLIAWCGFAGAWLLVAGPVFQAALELQEEDAASDEIGAASSAVAERYPRVSPWWWLLPPVYYLLQRRRSRQFRREVMRSLTSEQLEGLVSYLNKATGWFFVAAGAALIAVKETWELTELHHWPHAVFWVLVVVMAVLAVANTAVRMQRTRGVREHAGGHGPQPT